MIRIHRTVTLSSIVFLSVSFSCDQATPKKQAEARLPVRSNEVIKSAPVYAPDIVETAKTAVGASRLKINPTRVDHRDFERTEALSVIYRTSLQPAPHPRSAVEMIPEPVGELVVLLSQERIRVDFRGVAWAALDGAQLRSKRGNEQVYFFHESLGEEVSRKSLASRFQGGKVVRRGMYVSSSTSVPSGIKTFQICHLIEDILGLSRGYFETKCKSGVPKRFRIGIWRHELIAQVVREVSFDEIRVDHLSPPKHTMGRNKRLLVPAETLKWVHHKKSDERDGKNLGLAVENRSESRVFLSLGGSYIAYVNRDEKINISQLQSGIYALTALRPLGTAAIGERVVGVPGKILIR